MPWFFRVAAAMAHGWPAGSALARWYAQVTAELLRRGYEVRVQAAVG